MRKEAPDTSQSANSSHSSLSRDRGHFAQHLTGPILTEPHASL